MPQMNGMVERFNGRISELVKQTRFTSAAHLYTTLDNYCKFTTTTFRRKPSALFHRLMP
jgi:transposase InsO family protein